MPRLCEGGDSSRASRRLLKKMNPENEKKDMTKKSPVSLPIVDLHCDLLGYFAYLDRLDPMNTEDIGCAIPHLQKGNVKLQTLAIFSPPKPKKKKPGPLQVLYYQRLLAEFGDWVAPLVKADGSVRPIPGERIKVVAAVENATAFCSERESLQTGFKNLERMLRACRRLLYISFTHWSENRFGGGNDCHVGLKEDGKALLDYLDGRQIAVDFSHASDELIHDTLNYIDRRSLDVRVMASHSNFRRVCKHERNLPDELAKEVIRRGGVIGINFMRPYVDKNRPAALFEHIRYGIELGGEDALCFGADFFYDKPLVTAQDPHKTYHPAHRNAGKYPEIVKQLSEYLTGVQLEKLCWRNAQQFIGKLWPPAHNQGAAADPVR